MPTDVMMSGGAAYTLVVFLWIVTLAAAFGCSYAVGLLRLPMIIEDLLQGFVWATAGSGLYGRWSHVRCVEVPRRE